MELVEHHGADAAELGIAHQPPRQDALGDEADPRARAADVLEAHLVADGLAGRLAELFGDALRGHARGEAARLEDQDLAVIGEPAIEERAGTRVVLPAPGGASSTRFCPAARSSVRRGRRGSIGRASIGFRAAETGAPGGREQ